MRLIDADALKKSFCEWCGGSAQGADPDEVCGKTCATLDFFDEQPTVEAEPVRHGRWIPHDAYEEYDIAYCDYVCSECGHEITKRLLCVPPRCENCGAKMED